MAAGLDAITETIGRTPAGPAMAAFGVVVHAASPGHTTCRMRCPPELADRTGRLPGGAVAVLADAAIGRALLTLQPESRVTVTGRLQLNQMRTVTAETVLFSKADVVTADDVSGLVRADVVDSAGTLIAHATGRCFVVPGTVGMPLVIRAVDPGLVEDEVAREPADANGFLGIRWHNSEPGGVIADPSRLENMYGVLHGGATAAVLEAAIARAGGQPGSRLLDLDVHYLRPAAARGAALTVTVREQHHNRRFFLGGAELTDHRGRVLTCATATYAAQKTPSDAGSS